MDQATRKFQKRLEDLAAETGLDNKTGIFPLDSEFRTLGISYSTLFGAARALILQVAYPTVAQGVYEYSDFKNDPIGRGVRTFLGVFLIGIGTQESAINTGVLVFNKHRPIKGIIPAYKKGMKDKKYSAMEPGANRWVWATLVEGIMFGHQECNHAIDPARIEKFYQETKLFGKFFNVKESLIPETYADFQVYFDDMINNKLHVTPAGLQVADALVHAKQFPMKQGGWMLRAFAAESLPERIRDDFGWKSTAETRRIYGAVKRTMQTYYKIAPDPMKVVPLKFGPAIRKRFEHVTPSFIPSSFPLPKAA